MKKDKIYSLIIAICLILSLLLLYKMATYKEIKIYKPNIETKLEGNMQSLTNNDITQILLAALPSDLPLKDLKVNILKESAVRLNAHTTKVEVKEYLKGIGKLSYVTNSFLSFLPNDLSLETVLSLKTFNNMIVLNPISLSIASTNVSPELLGDDFIKSINTYVNEAIIPLNLNLSKLTFEDGTIFFG